MRLPAADLRELFASTKLAVLPEDYLVISLPLDAKLLSGEWFRPATTRFVVVIREEDKFVLIVQRRKWLRMKSIFKKYDIDGPLKVIDLAIDSAKLVPGYLTQLGVVLTEARIRIFPISSFSRNHLLVQKADLPRTIKVLRQFLDECKAGSE